MEELRQKVFSYMNEYGMLLPGERAVAGISGGADSVCLLFVLLEWREKYGLELAAVHVNHGIRPEAGEDARFVEELCRQHGVHFFLREADVRGYAAARKCSEEEAGRILRYQAFEETAEEFRADKIAVAHNLNDRAETMLFHLFRGSSIRGLGGIPPVRGKIIRPLLCLERREIEEYLAENGQKYCVDATNEKDDYTRNRIRHHIVPCAREINGSCVQHMGRTADLLAETEAYLEEQTTEALKRCVEDFSKGAAAPGYQFDVSLFRDFHPVLQKRMIYALIKALSPGAKDIAYIHVREVLSLFELDSKGRNLNRKICLPFGICAGREYEKVILQRQESDGISLQTFSVEFSVLSVENLPQNTQKSLIFPQNQYTKWFDCDKIKESPILRTRTTGDYLTIADGKGGMHHKSLQDYMVTEKIPESQRGTVPVLAEGSHVLWLVGYRISEYYKITENTKRVLQVQLIKECEAEDKNGRTC